MSELAEKEEEREEEKPSEYPRIFDNEYNYTVEYLKASCDNCGFKFQLNMESAYLIKKTVLLCDVCYWRIFEEHAIKRKLEWVGRRVFQRKMGKRPY